MMCDVPNILCVDDHKSSLEIRALLLREFGCEVCTAQDGDGALHEARARPIDLVLIDYDLAPGVTGDKVAAAIRAIAPSIRLVMLTGEPAVPDEARQQFDAVLLKGACNPADLWETIQVLLPAKKLRPQRAAHESLPRLLETG